MTNDFHAVNELFPHACGIIVNSSRQGILAIDVRDQHIGRRLLAEGYSDLDELQWLQGFLKPEDRVLIVGAHVGIFVIPLSKQVKEIYAIEANPFTYKYLCCNLILNDVTNVQTFNFAANDQGGSLRFVANTHNSGGSKRYPVFEADTFFYDKPDCIEVPAARLDDAFPETTYDVVTMDIEGSEVFALRGMPNILNGCRALVIEFMPHHLALVANITVQEFLAPIKPFFEYCHIMLTDKYYKKSEFDEVLSRQFASRQWVNIVFTKEFLQPQALLARSAVSPLGQLAKTLVWIEGH
jgi:FkbM family methyltransferase